jgi:hypothetical protein
MVGPGAVLEQNIPLHFNYQAMQGVSKRALHI